VFIFSCNEIKLCEFRFLFSISLLSVQARGMLGLCYL
jgi:hypothetical protein